MPLSRGIPDLARALRRACMGLESAGVTAEACSILRAETEAVTGGFRFFRFPFVFSLSPLLLPPSTSSNASPAAAAARRRCSMGTTPASSPGRGL